MGTISFSEICVARAPVPNPSRRSIPYVRYQTESLIQKNKQTVPASSALLTPFSGILQGKKGLEFFVEGHVKKAIREQNGT
jgi:hypothetical protein